MLTSSNKIWLITIYTVLSSQTERCLKNLLFLIPTYKLHCTNIHKFSSFQCTCVPKASCLTTFANLIIKSCIFLLLIAKIKPASKTKRNSHDSWDERRHKNEMCVLVRRNCKQQKAVAQLNIYREKNNVFLFVYTMKW